MKDAKEFFLQDALELAFPIIMTTPFQFRVMRELVHIMGLEDAEKLGEESDSEGAENGITDDAPSGPKPAPPAGDHKSNWFP